MIFSKKQKIQDNIYDRRRRELCDELWNCSTILQAKVREAFVANKVVELYPDGPDKEIAKMAAMDSRTALIFAVGAYDGARNDYLNYVSAHANAFLTTVQWSTKWISSHDLIEKTYAEIFQIPLDKQNS